MKHEFDLEQIDYDNSNYELDIWSSCFNPIFSPPPCVRRSAKSPRPAELSSGSAEIEQWDRPD